MNWKYSMINGAKNTLKSINPGSIIGQPYRHISSTLSLSVYIPVRGNRASRMPGTDIPETGNRYFYSINDLSRP